MNWLLRLATNAPPYDVRRIRVQDDDDSAENYFDIGHGDFHEESGTDPTYIVWVLIGGQVRMSNPVEIDEEGRHKDLGRSGLHFAPTHGTLWGHDVCSSEFKGRYEPKTGRISVVIPKGQSHRYNYAMKKLHQTFRYITNVSVFEC